MTMAWNSYLREGSVPIPARILHALQCALIFPSFPLGLICLIPLIFGEGIRLMLLFLFYPWVISSLFAHGVLLHKERKAARHGLLSKRRYLQLQYWKLGWSVVLYMPMFVAGLATDWMRHGLGLMVGEKGWFWESVLACNIMHWGFIAVSLLYGWIFYQGQVEGTIRLETDSPISLAGEETANDEEIARSLQSMEPEWRV